MSDVERLTKQGVIDSPRLGFWVHAGDFNQKIEQGRSREAELQQRLNAADGRVDVLEQALKFYADREHYHFESGNWDTVSGEPLNILWCGDEPDFIEDGTVARKALFGSAEPSAPKCRYCGDTGQFMVGSSGDASDGNAPIMARCEDCELGEPIAPIELKALRAFVGSAFPVANQINKRGYNWCESYLDDALVLAKAALKTAKCCTVSTNDQALLDAGDYTPEELFGVGGKPSCPKCSKP